MSALDKQLKGFSKKNMTEEECLQERRQFMDKFSLDYMVDKIDTEQLAEELVQEEKDRLNEKT